MRKTAFCSLFVFLLFASLDGLPRRKRKNFSDVIETLRSAVHGDDGSNDSSAQKATKHRGGRRHKILFDWATSCGDCDSELCEEPPANCPSGLIRDACDCCYVCGNLEDTPCDMPDQDFRFGGCGRGLICTPVSSSEKGLGEADAYCACADTTVVCGSDDRTYSNPCKFHRASGRKRGLEKRHDGPCLAAPVVEIPPMNQTAESGRTAVYSCSVSGYPLAWFEWLVNGKSVFTPGVDDGISIQIRSGPLKYQITSWLEIDKVRPSHSGTYQCVAKNQYGSANATARLDVIPGEYGDGNYYVYRGRNYQFLRDKIYNEKNKPKSQISGASYLDSHRLDDDAESQFSHSKLNAADDSTHQVDGDDDKLDELFVDALKRMARPKKFQNTFFDDDDLTTESSGEGTFDSV